MGNFAYQFLIIGLVIDSKLDRGPDKMMAGVQIDLVLGVTLTQVFCALGVRVVGHFRVLLLLGQDGISFAQEAQPMRKLIVAAGCLLLFCAGWVFGQQSAWNGTGWKSLNLSERTMYVMGFNQGHAAGMRDGFKEVLEVIAAARPGSSWTPQERQKLEEKADQIDQKSAAKRDFTVSQLEATVSAFYGDYRNMPVCWGDAILFSAASLAGKAQACDCQVKFPQFLPT